MRRDTSSLHGQWWRSYQFEGHSHGSTATVTQSGDASRLAALLERVEQSHHQAGTGGAERMPEGDGAAVDIHPVPVPLQRLAVGDNLRGESLIDLQQIPICEAGAGLLAQ